MYNVKIRNLSINIKTINIVAPVPVHTSGIEQTDTLSNSWWIPNSAVLILKGFRRFLYKQLQNLVST